MAAGYRPCAGRDVQGLGAGCCLWLRQPGGDSPTEKRAVFFSLLLGMLDLTLVEKQGGRRRRSGLDPSTAEAHLVMNQTESQQEKATRPAAASGAVRNLLESDFYAKLFFKPLSLQPCKTQHQILWTLGLGQHKKE